MSTNNRPARAEIRSIGLSKINRLVRAARHLDSLRPAFDQWLAGEIYVCKKTATYRFRFGKQAKAVAPWSKIAVELFGSPATFALAAAVLAPEKLEAAPEAPPLVAGPGQRPSTRGGRMKTLTVSKQFRQSGPDHRATWSKVPAIRLSGKWLARLGFAPGDKFTLRVEGSALVLSAGGPQ